MERLIIDLPEIYLNKSKRTKFDFHVALNKVSQLAKHLQTYKRLLLLYVANFQIAADRK